MSIDFIRTNEWFYWLAFIVFLMLCTWQLFIVYEPSSYSYHVVVMANFVLLSGLLGAMLCIIGIFKSLMGYSS